MSLPSVTAPTSLRNDLHQPGGKSRTFFFTPMISQQYLTCWLFPPYNAIWPVAMMHSLPHFAPSGAPGAWRFPVLPRPLFPILAPAHLTAHGRSWMQLVKDQMLCCPHRQARFLLRTQRNQERVSFLFSFLSMRFASVWFRQVSDNNYTVVS